MDTTGSIACISSRRRNNRLFNHSVHLSSHEPGSASNVAMAYSAAKRHMTQNSQPTGFLGGRRDAITAPTGEKLTAIMVFTDLSTDT